MTSLLNMFYSLDNSNEPPQQKIIHKSRHHKNTSANQTQSLNQGAMFNKYQNNIFKRTEPDMYKVNTREGFTSSSTSSSSDTTNYTDQSNDVLSSVKSSQSDIQNKIDLKKQYAIILKQYENKLNEVNGGTNDYMNRVNPSNTYINKNIRFSTGELGYVTNQGVVKLIPSPQILKSLVSCPRKNVVDANIPWLSSYNTSGTTIHTTPPLVSGTSMVSGETCGNEGNNVYVDRLVTNPTSTYKGCYGDNQSDPVMTFIGDSPPPAEYVINGNFDQPALANNSYKGYTSSSAVPGWTFNNGTIVNNASAWSYTQPYPNGSQAACIQKTASISQTFNFSIGTYTLKFIAIGRKYKSKPANPVNIQLNGTTFYTVTPPINVWTNYSTTFNVTTSGTNTITFLGTSTNTDESSAFQGISIGASSSNTGGIYSYDMCKNAAIDNGSQYFGLQSVNTSTGLGYCSAGSDGVGVYQYGESNISTGATALWYSNTSGTGSSASLTNQGSLSVFNSSGASIYQTTSGLPSNYLGCYTDQSTHAMTMSSGSTYDLSSCQLVAQGNGDTYYALQDSTTGTNAQCATSSDLGSIRKYGIATNCTKLKDGTYSGGGLSNAVYNNGEASSYYYLILQDDGNMCVYRGSGPSDNQGKIWCSDTNGKQQQSSSTYTAALGKYGKNWIASGSTLATGDFVGSTDGSIYLIMQTDGNLVLYTSQTTTNCSKLSDSNMGGGVNSNALYEISPIGDPSLLGSLGYVDSDSTLYSYPDSNKGLSDTYNKYENYDSTGNDLASASITNSTVDNCQSACTDNNDCYGFTFQKSTNTCFPKSSSTYPVGQRQTNTDYDLYARNPKLLSTPTGVPSTIVNIDSNTYKNYNNSGSQVGSSYGLSNINPIQKQELDQLQSRLDQISQQLVSDTGKTSGNNSTVGTQSTSNMSGLKDFLTDYDTTNNKIKQMGSVDNILNDSDITVLQENYAYLFWSILAVGTVLVTMNVVKK